MTDRKQFLHELQSLKKVASNQTMQERIQEGLADMVRETTEFLRRYLKAKHYDFTVPSKMSHSDFVAQQQLWVEIPGTRTPVDFGIGMNFRNKFRLAFKAEHMSKRMEDEIVIPQSHLDYTPEAFGRHYGSMIWRKLEDFLNERIEDWS